MDVKLEVMKAKLGEVRAKLLRQEALQELKALTKGTGVMLQVPAMAVEEYAISAAYSFSTR